MYFLNKLIDKLLLILNYGLYRLSIYISFLLVNDRCYCDYISLTIENENLQKNKVDITETIFRKSHKLFIL
jgi:hypothetical protein